MTLVVLTISTVVELLADNLPKPPARRAPPGLIARVVLGCLWAVALATSAGGNSLVPAIGGGWRCSNRDIRGLQNPPSSGVTSHIPDFTVAIAEEVIAVAGSWLIVSHV
jgi:uncharacterized membrane protein